MNTKLKLKKEIVDIPLYEGNGQFLKNKPVKVWAIFENGNDTGLCLHKDLIKDKKWLVTHKGSGKYIEIAFDRGKDALAWAKMLIELCPTWGDLDNLPSRSEVLATLRKLKGIE